MHGVLLPLPVGSGSLTEVEIGTIDPGGQLVYIGSGIPETVVVVGGAVYALTV